jgi:fucose 4-O-acetylase-like acetyltransferase
MNNLRDVLQPIADWFSNFKTPEPIVHWGHPLMMSIVVFIMGSFVALAGWRSRQLVVTDPDGATQNKAKHRKIAPLMYIFLASGYTGGLLSLVMQNQPILESPHFWTGSIAIVLLTINVVIAGTGFIGDKQTLRTVHAYVGSLALVILVFHAFLGLKLGLSI